MSKLHIKSDLSHAVVAFASHSKPISLRLDKEEIAMLTGMIGLFLIQLSKMDSELEAIVLKEIQQLLMKKYMIISNRANIPLTCSQARTIFIWLNDYTFEHPLQQSFSYKLVGDIYKQVI
jgi:hypothetical protein